MSVQGDSSQENDESFLVSLSSPTGSILGSSQTTATGVIRNDDVVGTSAADTLKATSFTTAYTGLGGADIFQFRYGQSPVSAPDRITDFAINTDKIGLIDGSGNPLLPPLAFSRASDQSSADLSTLVSAVFTDANGGTAGNQGLAVSAACLVRATSASIAGTYLVINDAVDGFQSSNDIVINITGLTGTLPPLGTIPVNQWFS